MGVGVLGLEITSVFSLALKEVQPVDTEARNVREKRNEKALCTNVSSAALI